MGIGPAAGAVVGAALALGLGAAPLWLGVAVTVAVTTGGAAVGPPPSQSLGRPQTPTTAAISTNAATTTSARRDWFLSRGSWAAPGNRGRAGSSCSSVG